MKCPPPGFPLPLPWSPAVEPMLRITPERREIMTRRPISRDSRNGAPIQTSMTLFQPFSG
jgi:hypothetical protein